MRNKIKILHLISSLANGGAERTLYNLLLNSNKSKFEHIVVSLKDKGFYGDLFLEHGIKIYTLNVTKNKPWKIFKIRLILKIEQPNIIQSWLYHADFLTLYTFVLGYRNIVWNIRNNKLNWSTSSKITIILRKICARLSFAPSKIICCASSAMHEHVKIGYQFNKFQIIPNGYDVDIFKPIFNIKEKMRQKLNIDESIFIIGNVGRDDPSKDRITLLTAIAKVKKQGYNNFKLLIIGRNVNNKSIMEILHKNNLINDVILMNEQYNINFYYNVMDLFVMSSKTEAFPNALVEAMATSIPCIVTKAGDAEKIINDSNLVVDIGDSNKLAELIINFLIMSKDKRIHVGQNLYKRVQSNYSIKSMVSSYEELYYNLEQISRPS